MKHLYILIPLLLIVSFATADEPVRERIEWIDIWVTDADKTDLPRVLLVGDSITRGYFGAVEKQLAGKAYCARLTTSKCVSDPTFDDDLKLLLKQYNSHSAGWETIVLIYSIGQWGEELLVLGNRDTQQLKDLLLNFSQFGWEDCDFIAQSDLVSFNVPEESDKIEDGR